MKKICVFCGSHSAVDEVYLNAATELGQLIAKKGLTLVYGGSKRGLMGKLADAVFANNGKVIGIMPRSLQHREAPHRSIRDMHIVETLAERKNLMAEYADAFIVMPGGLGTLDELFEMWTLLQLRQIIKPIGILNIEGYYDGLLKFLQHCVDENFIRRGDANHTLVEYDAAALLDRFLDRF